MDDIQIVIFILTLLYFIFSSILKKKKKAEDFEWEGDGTLDDIVQQSEQSGEHETTWKPWLEEIENADEFENSSNSFEPSSDSVDDEFHSADSSVLENGFEDEFAEGDSFEERFEPISNKSTDSFGKEEFEETFSSAVSAKNTDPQLKARIEKKIQEALHAQTSVFKGEIFSANSSQTQEPLSAFDVATMPATSQNNMSNKTAEGVAIDSLLSKYSSAELLVVLPAIMNRKG